MEEESALELYLPERAGLTEQEIRSRIIKEHAVDLCVRYPHVFRLLPIGRGPQEQGTWAKYPYDDVMEFYIDASHPEALEFFKIKIQEEKEAIMSQALTKQEEVGIKTMLAANIKAIRTVLPKHMTPERMMRVAFTAISRVPMLARCTPVSLLNCVIEASMLGLEVNTPLGQAVMVPFYNSKTKQYEAQLIPEYKGKIELAYRSGMVKSFQAHAVFEKDKFHYEYGLTPNLVHVPGKDKDRGKLIAAYAVVNYINGGVDFEVIEEAEAMAAKARSKGAEKDSSPWNSEEDEPSMWMKTAVHRLWKRVPKSPEYQQIARAKELEAKAEAGESQDFEWLQVEGPAEPKALDGGAGADPGTQAGGNGGNGGGQAPPETEEKKEEGGKKEEEPPPPPEPPQDKKKDPEKPPQSNGLPKGTPMEQLKALEKANYKLYKQACQESEILMPISEPAALIVLRKAREISEGKGKGKK